MFDLKHARSKWHVLIVGLAIGAASCGTRTETDTIPPFFPAHHDTGVNVDILPRITFDAPPSVGNSGFITIRNVETGEIVDQIDMSVPPSPRPTGRMAGGNQAAFNELARNSKAEDYQLDIIGGYDFHFFPIMVDGNTATIYPHHNKLDYGTEYEISLDEGVILQADGSSQVYSWSFTTRTDQPDLSDGQLVVSADGNADFNTVQGAIDYVPDTPEAPLEILIRNGDYKELVFMDEKSNLVLRGESRDGVVVGYPNNSVFNPSRGGPSRRPAFSVNNSSDIQLSTFTIKNYFIGQAEALKAVGDRIVIDRMSLDGSGDAFTTRGSIYMVDSIDVSARAIALD